MPFSFCELGPYVPVFAVEPAPEAEVPDEVPDEVPVSAAFGGGGAASELLPGEVFVLVDGVSFPPLDFFE